MAACPTDGLWALKGQGNTARALSPPQLCCVACVAPFTCFGRDDYSNRSTRPLPITCTRTSVGQMVFRGSTVGASYLLSLPHGITSFSFSFSWRCDLNNSSTSPVLCCGIVTTKRRLPPNRSSAHTVYLTTLFSQSLFVPEFANCSSRISVSKFSAS